VRWQLFLFAKKIEIVDKSSLFSYTRGYVEMEINNIWRNLDGT
jgi:hypothetical protein